VLLDHLQPARPRETKVPPSPRSPQPKAPTAAPADLPDDVTPADVRGWGLRNGWEVGVRGRLNHDLLAAFVTARAKPRRPKSQRQAQRLHRPGWVPRLLGAHGTRP
jgi:hypothetical protein